MLTITESHIAFDLCQLIAWCFIHTHFGVWFKVPTNIGWILVFSQRRWLESLPSTVKMLLDALHMDVGHLVFEGTILRHYSFERSLFDLFSFKDFVNFCHVFVLIRMEVFFLFRVNRIL